jgi:hypothetical protein
MNRTRLIRVLKPLVAILIFAGLFTVVPPLVCRYFTSKSDAILGSLNLEVNRGSVIHEISPFRQESLRKPTAIKIESPTDFLTINISPSPNSISYVLQVSSLTEPYDEFPSAAIEKKLGKLKDITKHLEVVGRISEEWLQILMERLTPLEELVLNLDRLCEGASVEDRGGLKALYLPSLKHLTFEESQWCQIITWPLRWKLPALQTLHLNKIQFTNSSFNQLVDFLKEEHIQLQDVTLKECTCILCDFIDLPATVNVNII